MIQPKVVIVIPARFGSTRLPGKPLADIAGKPMIQHVVERASMVRGVQAVVVAVDCDNPRTAFGQQADGRAPDDSGSTGNDGNPAVEANSIGHRHSPLGASRLFPVLASQPARRAWFARLFHL